MANRIGAYLRSNVLGLVAIFIALTAGAYAAGLPRNSVKSKQIKDGQIRSPDVRNDGLTGIDLEESTLDTAVLQSRIAASCPSASALRAVSQSGGVSCADSIPGPPTGAAGGDLSGSFPDPALRASEPLHVVGDPGEPPFSNDWTHYGGPYAPVSYYKDRLGIVHLQGLAAGTEYDGHTIFGILGAEYQPCGYGDRVFPVLSNDATGRVGVGTVTAPGNPTTIYAVNGVNWISLEGVSWRASPC